MSHIKKSLPKIKKKLQDFLTDESGKITKKDALGISATALLLVWAEEVVADSKYNKSEDPDLPYPSDDSVYRPQTHPAHVNSATTEFVLINANTCNHASGIVNGHYSAMPSVDTSSNTVYELTNTHTSHSNSTGAGWCAP